MRELNRAITCFARAIARTWPATEAEAREWVREEFCHPRAAVFGAFDRTFIGGVIASVPLSLVLDHLDEHERSTVLGGLEATTGQAPNSQAVRSMLHVGGLGVEQVIWRKGVGSALHNHLRGWAVKQGYRFMVGHTARSSAAHPRAGCLDFVYGLHGKALPIGQKIFYSSPEGLEKVWIYYDLR